MSFWVKETIDLYNTSETRSNQKSFGLNYQKTGKQLMTEDEIAVMDGGKCILQIRGARPFFSRINMISRNTKTIGFLQMKMKTDTK